MAEILALWEERSQMALANAVCFLYSKSSPRSVVTCFFYNNFLFSLIINFYKNFSSVANCFLFSSSSFSFLEYHSLINYSTRTQFWVDIQLFQLWIPHFYAVSFSLYSIRHWVSPRIYFDSWVHFTVCMSAFYCYFFSIQHIKLMKFLLIALFIFVYFFNLSIVFVDDIVLSILFC